jgi:hypothetical protein
MASAPLLLGRQRLESLENDGQHFSHLILGHLFSIVNDPKVHFDVSSRDKCECAAACDRVRQIRGPGRVIAPEPGSNFLNVSHFHMRWFVTSAFFAMSPAVGSSETIQTRAALSPDGRGAKADIWNERVDLTVRAAIRRSTRPPRSTPWPANHAAAECCWWSAALPRPGIDPVHGAESALDLPLGWED